MTSATTRNSHLELDTIVHRLAGHAPRWANLNPSIKATLLSKCLETLDRHAQHFVDLSAAAKSLNSHSPWVGEEWLTGPWAIAASLHAYTTTLTAIAAGRRPSPVTVRERPDGQVIAKVFPRNAADRIMLHAVTAEVWMQPDVTVDNLPTTIASTYFDNDHSGELALVLGAGNVNSIPVLDTLYELIAHRRVVLLKLNPINDYLAGPLRAILDPLIDVGALAIVTGAVPEGQYLIHHEAVDKVHITGSATSHDAIVFGPGDDGTQRKARNQVVLNKPITSELGGVGPIIVVPGPWTPADIAYQAQNIATMRLHNAGANCVAAQVLVLPVDWAPATRLVEAIQAVFDEQPPRAVYYPNAQARLDDARRDDPTAQASYTGAQQRILVTNIDPSSDHVGFQHEAFAPILYQTSLLAVDAANYLNEAIAFANDRLMGSLGATILIHPRTQRQLGAAFEDAIAGLRYGAVGVNIWNAAAFLLPGATWGAFPGHLISDIQSGTGVVHNALLFDKPEKAVVRGPFTPFPRSTLSREPSLAPRAPWLITHPHAEAIGRHATRYTLTRHLRHLIQLAVAAYRR